MASRPMQACSPGLHHRLLPSCPDPPSPTTPTLGRHHHTSLCPGDQLPAEAQVLWGSCTQHPGLGGPHEEGQPHCGAWQGAQVLTTGLRVTRGIRGPAHRVTRQQGRPAAVSGPCPGAWLLPQSVWSQGGLRNQLRERVLGQGVHGGLQGTPGAERQVGQP